MQPLTTQRSFQILSGVMHKKHLVKKVQIATKRLNIL